MGSKRFKNDLCVYCNDKKSVGGDHIFARKFFLPDYRGHLPQVPACKSCNEEKSNLEHYLTAIMPFGGRHKHALQNLREQVPKRLAKNQRLYREFSQGQADELIYEDNQTKKTMSLPFDASKIESLFKFIVKGLAWHHWRTNLPDKISIEVSMLTESGRRFYEERYFSLQAADSVSKNLANDTVIYKGIQGIDCPQVTAWLFQIYGGIILGGDKDNSELRSTEIGATSCPT